MITIPLKCAGVSFPRSGHHALYAVLSEYFGDSLKYHDKYLVPPANQIALADSNYCKDHDLELTVPVDPSLRYVIQTRHPREAIQSWLDYDARVTPSCQINTRVEWEQRFGGMLEFWCKWYSKWVISDIPQRLIVTYERLLNDPTGVMRSILQFMTGTHADQAVLRDALEKFPIKATLQRPPTWINFA